MSIDFQRRFDAHGIKGELGRVRFESGKSTIQVPTGLGNVFVGFGQIQTSDTQSAVPITCDNRIVQNDNGKKVTFTRHSGYLNCSPTLNYIVFGW